MFLLLQFESYFKKKEVIKKHTDKAFKYKIPPDEKCKKFTDGHVSVNVS